MDKNIIDNSENSANKRVITEVKKQALKLRINNESASPPRDIQDNTETKTKRD
eukprot:CAMPEP_0172480074 /NCGR_PEP_ID=MMETSP1066-20121228/5003_1 /TAXON_ID=671091 /ORGANISM="Coscinodiscus wailesii, Strain CCMP2513" /LENGTH=52 /DNA_ID=CAMNT_0013241073 /DNA_START=158 /DNA_END=316 /DNA_ORIENTATION=-